MAEFRVIVQQDKFVDDLRKQTNCVFLNVFTKNCFLPVSPLNRQINQQLKAA
jgi:hypothetical protein